METFNHYRQQIASHALPTSWTLIHYSLETTDAISSSPEVTEMLQLAVNSALAMLHEWQMHEAHGSIQQIPVRTLAESGNPSASDLPLLTVMEWSQTQTET